MPSLVGSGWPWAGGSTVPQCSWCFDPSQKVPAALYLENLNFFACGLSFVFANDKTLVWTPLTRMFWRARFLVLALTMCRLRSGVVVRNYVVKRCWFVSNRKLPIRPKSFTINTGFQKHIVFWFKKTSCFWRLCWWTMLFYTCLTCLRRSHGRRVGR